MRNIIIIGLCLLLTSCFKDRDKDFYFRDFTVEFQDAVITTNAVGKKYPIINAKEGENKIQVNLIGGVLETDEVVDIKVLADETSAVAGQHYTLQQEGQVKFPAKTAIGELTIEVPAVDAGTDVVLVVDLQPSSKIKVSNNYKTIGLRIKK